MESCLENRDNCIESLKRSLTDQCHLENLKYKEKYVITQVHMECWSGENAVYLNLQLRAGNGAARHDTGVLARHGSNVNKCPTHALCTHHVECSSANMTEIVHTIVNVECLVFNV